MNPSPKPLLIVAARENNLKGVTLELPHNTFIAVTGLSGSGKSSLAFDTVYAEGQRRYIETFSPYTRQFFDKVKKPDVELIENVRPAIAIQQRTRVTGSRSTVGSMTNLNDYIKILWTNLSEAVCPVCEKVLRSWTPASLARHLGDVIAQKRESTILLCAKYKIASQKRLLAGEIERLVTLGFTRILNPVSGEVLRLEDTPSPPLTSADEIVIVLDRVRGGSTNLKRLRDTIDQAFSLSDGRILIADLSEEAPQFSEFFNYFLCIEHGTRINRPRPALFSFNHPYGACEECKGFGRILTIDPARCVPDPSLSIKDHAIQCWAKEGAKGEYRRLLRFCEKEKISITKPWKSLAQKDRDAIFRHKSRDYVGVLPWFKRLEKKIYKMHVRVFLSRYRTQSECPSCKGSRLKQEALSFQIFDRKIHHLWEMSIGELALWLERLEGETRSRREVFQHLKDVFGNILARLRYLNDLGLSYLTLNRAARTLSGGETQRVNLAAALGSELVSTHFVLDEPSVGLHARDTERLIRSIRALNEKGNSLLVVEHDPEVIFSAEHIVELGPEAGKTGGEIVYNGPVAGWSGIHFDHYTLSKEIPSGARLTIRGARARNLKGVSVDIPLGSFVSLTGVSGSGKSTLVHEVIKSAWEARAQHRDDPLPLERIDGFEAIDELLLVDQSPLAKSPRANIATYSGVWDTVRDLLAATEEASIRSLSKSSFSFNVNAGRCSACEGAGFIREDMQFLSDVFIPCEVCLGKRFQEIVLEVRYEGKNVDELLRMTVEEALVFFSRTPKLKEPLSILSQLGLGHLTLGHSLSELSGGEAQRLKLVPFLERGSKGKNLLIFDEPTTGLHTRDVQRLVELFRLLVEKGNSILCIEHNLLLVAQSDWIIDLGPEGGDGGGELLFSGTPHDLLEKDASSYTARYLAEFLKRVSGPESKQKKVFALPSGKSRGTSSPSHLSIRGAREHNLKDVSLDIPLNTIVALTGVSGSGKSSIAKDIVYAEGQRRYLDCLSPYARQFIKELKKPEIDSITNVQPTICVYQHTFQPSHLSTVGTMSEVYNFLRLLYAKVGTQFCPHHPDKQISPLSAEEIARVISTLKGDSVRILAPIIKSKKGLHKAVFERALASEMNEVRVDGIFGRPAQFEDGLAKTKPHSIEYVAARFNPGNISHDLILESVTLALGLGGGTLIVHHKGDDTVFSVERTCPECQKGFFKPDPEDLSFHSKRGACPECQGSGEGDDGLPCPECGGARIGSIGRNLRIRGLNIFETASLPPSALLAFIESLGFDTTQRKISEPVLREVISKAKTLVALGLDYLSLARSCSTLSGGELQRLRLATAMGSPLSGVLYIFDEPSVGLHPLDNARVLTELHGLKEQGNSVIIIEHDPQSILACEWIIDVGPGGGRLGGEIVYSGPVSKFISDSDSLTAHALSTEPLIEITSGASEKKPSLHLSKGTRNNIKNLSLSLPLESLVTFAGVSGAGKSTLLHGIIAETILEGSKKNGGWQSAFGALASDKDITRLLFVDQKPVGANSRSTPASYLGIWDEIRKLFAKTLEAQSRGWGPGFFSYNTGKGRCSECAGQGFLRLEMNFLADAEVQCEACKGSRYGEEIGNVRYLGYTVSEVLALTFEEAKSVFANHRKIFQPLRFACDLGLGYLTLGQGSSTLSGGESQRIKLVSELSTPSRGHTLYILDEPTTGLHRTDVARLISGLKSLVKLGNSVFLIEHDSDVIRASDHVVEVGPGPGEKGGGVIFNGPPEKLCAATTPWGCILSKAESGAMRNVLNL